MKLDILSWALSAAGKTEWSHRWLLAKSITGVSVRASVILWAMDVNCWQGNRMEQLLSLYMADLATKLTA